MKTKLLLLSAVVGLQTAWILGTTLVQERVLTRGTVILLETRPVDPRDLLRGDYMILGYKIGQIPLSFFPPPMTAAVSPGTEVYVGLQPNGEFFEAARASLAPLSPTSGEVILKGRVRSGAGLGTVSVDYGLERYYVPEGKGNPQGQLTVQVAVSAAGRGVIKKVLVNGEPYPK